MKPVRVIEVLKKMKRIHEENPQLAMTDVTNEEIVNTLEIAINAMDLVIELARQEIRSLEEYADDEKGN